MFFAVGFDEFSAESVGCGGEASSEVLLDLLCGRFSFGLVLCDGVICAREQIRVTPYGDAFQFNFADEAEPDIPPLLDPPVGVRREWLDKQLGKHEFVVLLYYRGLW